MQIDTVARSVTYLSITGDVVQISVKEANTTNNEELKKRFNYIKSILKGGDSTKD